jgi:hypothetical protein
MISELIRNNRILFFLLYSIIESSAVRLEAMIVLIRSGPAFFSVHREIPVPGTPTVRQAYPIAIQIPPFFFLLS